MPFHRFAPCRWEEEPQRLHQRPRLLHPLLRRRRPRIAYASCMICLLCSRRRPCIRQAPEALSQAVTHAQLYWPMHNVCSFGHALMPLVVQDSTVDCTGGNATTQARFRHRHTDKQRRPLLTKARHAATGRYRLIARPSCSLSMHSAPWRPALPPRAFLKGAKAPGVNRELMLLKRVEARSVVSGAAPSLGGRTDTWAETDWESGNETFGFDERAIGLHRQG